MDRRRKPDPSGARLLSRSNTTPATLQRHKRPRASPDRRNRAERPAVLRITSRPCMGRAAALRAHDSSDIEISSSMPGSGDAATGLRPRIVIAFRLPASVSVSTRETAAADDPHERRAARACTPASAGEARVRTCAPGARADRLCGESGYLASTGLAGRSAPDHARSERAVRPGAPTRPDGPLV